MDESTLISTAQAAKALGVGVSTVKRWVDDGILTASKTAGGHRKLSLADLLRLAKEKDFPLLDLRRLSTAPPPPRAAETRLYQHLMDGNDEGVEGLIHAAYLNGQSIGEIADHLIRPAMCRIGDEWAAGRIDILHEHRATRLCTEAILGLKQRIDERPRSRRAGRPLAVGGSPESHWHSLADLLAEAVLIEAGWQVMNLGPNTPLASFRRAIQEFRPRLLWLSIGPIHDAPAFLAEYKAMYHVAYEAETAVVVGGLGLTTEIRDQMPYTFQGQGLTQLAEFARTLHPIPLPRRRGRPVREDDAEESTHSPDSDSAE